MTPLEPEHHNGCRDASANTGGDGHACGAEPITVDGGTEAKEPTAQNNGTSTAGTGQLELPGLSVAATPAVTSAAGKDWAEDNPVAQVLVFAHVPHLSGVYDYAVPRRWADHAWPGHLVRVRFSGRLTDGFVLQRMASSGYVGTLAPIDRVLTTYQLLQPDVAEAARNLAARYGGSWADVLRLAVPSRHVRAETEVLAHVAASHSIIGSGTSSQHDDKKTGQIPPELAKENHIDFRSSVKPSAQQTSSRVDSVSDFCLRNGVTHVRCSQWEGIDSYQAGKAFVQRSLNGHAPLAWIQAMPGASCEAVPRWAQTISGFVWEILDSWHHRQHSCGDATSKTPSMAPTDQRQPPSANETQLAHQSTPCAQSLGQQQFQGQTRRAIADAGAVIVVCGDHRAVEHVVTALGSWLPSEALAVLQSDAGAATRFGEYVMSLLGPVQVVVGTRSAVWAPVSNLLGTIVVEPSADTMTDGRSPHVQAADVARARGALTGAGTLLMEWSGSLVCRRWVGTGEAKELVPVPGVRRAALARCQIVGAQDRDPFGGRGGWSHEVVRAARAAVQRGAVLVHSSNWTGPAAVRCKGCAGRVRCQKCAHPLTVATARSGGVVPGSAPSCGQCLRTVGAWRCKECGAHEWVVRESSPDRAVGDVGRLVPGAKVVMVTAQRRSVRHPGGPGVVVVSTRGAEPVVPGGYALVVVLDARRLWDAQLPDADVTAVQTWSRLVGLAAPARDGGQVLFTEADPQAMMAQVCRDRGPQLVDELVTERLQMGAAPVVPSVALAGAQTAVMGLLDEWASLSGVVPWRVWGPVAGQDGVRLLVVPPMEMTEAAAIGQWQHEAAAQVGHVRTGRAVRGLPVPQAVVSPV